MSISLREQDFYAWTAQQAGLLRAGDYGAAEMLAVAEEIEERGASDLRALESDLVRLLEHLLKWRWSPAAAPRRGWKRSIVEHRLRLRRAVGRSGALRAKLPGLLADAYADARTLAALGLEEDGRTIALPRECPFSLEQILAEDWFPDALDQATSSR